MILKKNIKKLFLILSVILLLLPFIFVLELYTNKIHHLYIDDYVESDSLVCIIYDVKLDGTLLYIEGGVATVGISENYARENKFLYFKNNNTGKLYATRIGEINIGDNLTNYIADGNDYSISGFAAELNLKSLDIFNNSYSIYCCEQNAGVNMITDTFIDIEYGKLL